LWDENRDGRVLIVIGLLAGYCYAAKYTAFVMIVYALVFVVWRTRQWRPALTVVGCSLIMIAPWAIKNWVYVHNPVAPFANQWFPNPYFYVRVEEDWTAQLRNYSLTNIWTLPLEVTVRGLMTQGLLGPVFLAAPLALLALRSREGRKLLVPFALVLLPYAGNIGTRFLISTLPFLSLALALALESLAPALLIAVILFHAAASWPPFMRIYCDKWVWSLHEIPVRAALRIIPEGVYLADYQEYQWARMIETRVPPGKVVFSFTGVADAYTNREVLISYWGALNNDVGDALTMGWNKYWQPEKVWTFTLPNQKYRRLRLLQTATGTIPQEQWNIHELRFFHDGTELARRPDWRLQAWPDPWGVQRAFDNSDATRWRSWDTLRPGMWMSVDFGHDERIDEVRVELSGDEWEARMKLESMDASGRWIPLDARVEQRRAVYSGLLRKAATYDAHLRGVDYFLIKDSDFGAKDYAEYPESWGWTRLEHAFGASLYRVNP
jgi:hypothetical protein